MTAVPVPRTAVLVTVNVDVKLLVETVGTGIEAPVLRLQICPTSQCGRAEIIGNVVTGVKVKERDSGTEADFAG